MLPDWLRFAFEVCKTAQFWTKLLKSWTQRAFSVKFCTHILTRPRKKCHFIFFKSASWWRYNRPLHVFIYNSLKLCMRTPYRHWKKLCPAFSHLPFTAPPGDPLRPRTLFDVTPSDFIQISHKSVHMISTVMWSIQIYLPFHIPSSLFKIDILSLQGCFLFNKLPHIKNADCYFHAILHAHSHQNEDEMQRFSHCLAIAPTTACLLYNTFWNRLWPIIYALLWKIKEHMAPFSHCHYTGRPQ